MRRRSEFSSGRRKIPLWNVWTHSMRRHHWLQMITAIGKLKWAARQGVGQRLCCQLIVDNFPQHTHTHTIINNHTTTAITTSTPTPLKLRPTNEEEELIEREQGGWSILIIINAFCSNWSRIRLYWLRLFCNDH